MTRPLLVALLAVALLLPASMAQSPTTPDVKQTRDEILKQPGQLVTFYGHIFGIDQSNPMPMNTQFPAGEADYSIGFASGCGNPPPLPADTGCETWTGNNQLWYSTAGFVQVKTAEQWGGDYGLFHNERGMTKDVYVDTSQKPVSTYYMSADFHGWLVALCSVTCWNWDPGYYQDWVVESWLWHAPTGELHSSPSDKPDMSAVIGRTADAVLMAHGKTEPFDLWSLDPSIPTGQQTVWPFISEMDWDEAFAATDGSVPLTSNIIMEFRWYQETDGQKYIWRGGTAPNWNVNSGEDFPANVVIPVRNPLDVELVYPQFIHDKLVLLSVINTPWGSYDIDPALIKLVVKDSGDNLVQFKDGTLTRIVEQSVAHSGHYQPIKPTWVWDYKTQGLRPGDYTVTVEVTNFQHSVTSSTTGLFTINADGGGSTQAGQKGLQSLQGSIHDGHQGTAADPSVAQSTSSTAPAVSTEESPGLAVPLLGAALVALALLRRRQA